MDNETATTNQTIKKIILQRQESYDNGQNSMMSREVYETMKRILNDKYMEELKNDVKKQLREELKKGIEEEVRKELREKLKEDVSRKIEMNFMKNYIKNRKKKL